MKHKQDIYKKPKIPVTEIIGTLIVAVVLGGFIFFEFSAYMNKLPRLDRILVFDGSCGNTTEAAPIVAALPQEAEALAEVAAAAPEKPAKAAIETVQKTAPKKEVRVAAAESEGGEEAPDTETVVKHELSAAEAEKAAQEKSLLQMMVNSEDPHQKFGETTLIEKVLGEEDPIVIQEITSQYTHFSPEDKAMILLKEIDANHAKTVTKLLDRGYALTEPYPKANELISTRKYTMAILLLKRGVISPNAKNRYGYTLLHEAAAKGHATLIRLLVSLGADINAQADDGASALHYPAHLGFNIAVSTLIALGIDVNMKATLKYPGLDWNGYTPLHVAASRGKYEVVEKLLQAGAKVDEPDNSGMTAYDIAKEKQYTKVIELLKPFVKLNSGEQGSDTNATHTTASEGDTAEGASSQG